MYRNSQKFNNCSQRFNDHFQRFNDRSKSRGKSRLKTNITCFHCRKLGHVIKDRQFMKREKSRDRGNNYNKREDKDETITTVVSNGEVVIVYDHDSINLTNQEYEWVVDFAASFHVTPHRDYFISYTVGDFGHVKMGNQGVSKIVGIGDIWFKTNIGCKLHLKNVKHIPDIRLSLIFVQVLDEDGYYNFFGDETWKCTKGSMVVAKEEKRNTLYWTTTTKFSTPQVNAVDDCSIQLWHKRLCHFSEKGLATLSRQGLLSVKGTSLETCSDCLFGKQHRVSFLTYFLHKRPHVLDLIHTDVCTMSDRSISGCSYFVTFIDDHSRKVWDFVLKSKDQVLDVFKHLHASVEREICTLLKCVRVDNGGEYMGPFENYYKEHGIKIEKNYPKTPQHNAVAKRMNHTINDRIRCLLSHAKLPKVFQGEELKTTVNLINLSPSIPSDVPERVWKGKVLAQASLK